MCWYTIEMSSLNEETLAYCKKKLINAYLLGYSYNSGNISRRQLPPVLKHHLTAQ